MTELTKVSTKGQVVIPQELRDALGLKPGDTLQLERVGDIIALKKVELASLKDELKKGGRR
jgi:AbrB family looped-hinge helix DNA binding protein